MCERFVVNRAELAGFDNSLVHQDQQVCKTGVFNEDGFHQQTWRKVHMLSTLEVGKSYCYVDADCVLFPGLADWCEQWLSENKDAIGHGDDIRQLCMGSIVWRQTKDTRRWFQYVYHSAVMFGRHDQETVQILSELSLNPPVELLKMPNDIFANFASRQCRTAKPWDGEELFIPATTLCWHANFCVGIERKTKMLEMVLAKMQPASCVSFSQM